MSEETLVDSSAPEPSTNESAAPAESGSQAAPAQAQSDVWGTFRTLPDFKGQDDRAIAGRLYSSLEREKAATKALSQYQQLIPYAQEYLTYRPQFQQWVEQQQSRAQQPPAQQQQASQPEASKWWNPPALRESYKQYLVKDENGRETISQNAPLDAQHALYEYQKYKADFAQKFLSDPQQALGPMVEKIAAERAQEIVESQMRSASDATFVSSLEKDNSDWLYNQDGSPSREGLMIQRYIASAANAGFSTPQSRWEYACDMLERDLLREAHESRASLAERSQFQQAIAPPVAAPSAPERPATQNQAEKDIEYLRREASRNPSRSGPATDSRAPAGPMTFEQRLRHQMAKDGLD